MEKTGSHVRVTNEPAGSGGRGELFFLINDNYEKRAKSSERRGCGKQGSFREGDSSWLGLLSFRS